MEPQSIKRLNGSHSVPWNQKQFKDCVLVVSVPWNQKQSTYCVNLTKFSVEPETINRYIVCEISPTRCNNCVFILRNGFYSSANFVIPNGRIHLIQLPLGVLVLVSKFSLLGVDEF